MEQRLDRNKNERRGISKDLILSFVAYIAIGFIAVALLLTLIFKGNTTVSNVFNAIGQVIAYILCIILAFYWVKEHKQIAWIVCYVVFVVTILVLFILTL